MLLYDSNWNFYVNKREKCMKNERWTNADCWCDVFGRAIHIMWKCQREQSTYTYASAFWFYVNLLNFTHIGIWWNFSIEFPVWSVYLQVKWQIIRFPFRINFIGKIQIDIERNCIQFIQSFFMNMSKLPLGSTFFSPYRFIQRFFFAQIFHRKVHTL